MSPEINKRVLLPWIVIVVMACIVVALILWMKSLGPTGPSEQSLPPAPESVPAGDVPLEVEIPPDEDASSSAIVVPVFNRLC